MALNRKPSSSECISPGRITARLLLSFLILSTPAAVLANLPHHESQLPILPPSLTDPELPPPTSKDHLFTLRHVFHHGDLNRPGAHRRLDVPKAENHLWIESENGIINKENRLLVVKSSPTKINRLKDRRPSVVDPMVAAAREYPQVWASSADSWTMDMVDAPDVTNLETILTFAQMAANAYVEQPDTGDWKDVHGGFNRTDEVGFGWDSDGLRGYLYADENNSTIVIGLKGTTLAIWDGDGTTTNDKENDNLFFSCCCGQQGNTFYRQVCNCATGTYTCNLTCLKKSLRKENRYYAAARHLYNNVTALYPGSNVWMSGHSLGGSISAMIGLTYGTPILTFQAVPDALPANRLGLPVPPGINPDKPGQRDYTGAFHFGHNSDPIYMGTCNGATATCSYAGYALETTCHTGRKCVWDTVETNGTRVSVVTHKIIYVIENVIKRWTRAPECKFTPECYDCPLWKEVTGNSSNTATLPPPTSTSTKTRTRTSTCQTPGWWGCLDKTTTVSGTSTSTSSTSITTSTVTCKTPGWFGCNDETSTETTPSRTAKKPPTSTCKGLGWFGCDDPLSNNSSSVVLSTTITCSTPGYVWGCHDSTTGTITRTHVITPPPRMPTTSHHATITSQSCTSSVWFGLICVDPSPIPTQTPTRPPKHKQRCAARSWLGCCIEWEYGPKEAKEEI